MCQVKVVRLETDSAVVPLTEVGDSVRMLLWPEMGALQRQLFHFDFRAGGTSILLRHTSEAVYYVTEGSGQIMNTDTGEVHHVSEGAMVYVTGNQGYKLAGHCVFIGGPCPPDLALMEAFRAENSKPE